MKSARDAAEGRQTNFTISPEILRFSRQVLGEWDPGNEPTQCMKIVRELVNQRHQTADTTEMNPLGVDEDNGDQDLARRMGLSSMERQSGQI